MPSEADKAADAELALILKEKRARNRAPLTQPQLAEEAGVSQSLISSIERGYRSMRSLPGERVEAVLTAYGFTSGEQVELVRRFRLQLPPSWIDAERDKALSGLESIRMEGTLSRPEESREVLKLPTELVQGYRLETLRARRVTGDSYATMAAHRFASEGALIIRSTELQPEPGLPCLYHLPGGPDFLATYDASGGEQLVGSWLLPYSDEHPPIKIRTRPVFAAVVVGAWSPFLRFDPEP